MGGKYPPSKIHEQFSYWHYNSPEVKENAYMTDIDRIWVETRKSKIIAVWDLKTFHEWENYEEPYSEGIVRNFFEEQKIPYFVVAMDLDKTPSFIISRWGKTKQLNKLEMANFINNLEIEIKNWFKQE